MSDKPFDAEEGVSADQRTEKSALKIAIAGGFMGLLGTLETLVFVGIVQPPADMATGVHTLFIGAVSATVAFLYKSFSR